MIVERALILAAGRGVRMGPRGKSIPKGFIEIGGRSLIERSLHLLSQAGIRDIVIVTGHLADHYEKLLPPEGTRLSLVHNPHYAERGSFASLLLGLAAIEAPVLLLESDLIYESRALAAALSSEHENVILASGPTGAGDEVYVWADQDAGNCRFRGMSKTRAFHPDAPYGELVGILKLSGGLVRSLTERAPDLTADADYESAVVAAAQDTPIACLKIDDLLWGEIDDEAMLARVVQRLWPRMSRGG